MRGRWRDWAAKVATWVALAGAAAGCASQTAAAGGSVNTCFQFGKSRQRQVIGRDILLAWISYLATGLAGLAWVACGLLLAVASLGMTLVFLGPATGAAVDRSGDKPRPAGHRSALAVAAHITAACATILLAVLAAIGSG